MALCRIEVECYSGSRADERPRRIRIHSREYVVVSLLRESVEESLVTREKIRHYKVLTDQGLVLDVLRKEDGAWLLDSSPSV